MDGAREAKRWRDVWQLFPGRAGAFKQQSAFESEWASIEPLASDLPFTSSPKGQIKLKDGSTVSGAQLKYDWLRTDFEINPVGTVYGEGTAYPQTRGEANCKEGNPLIRMNIDILVGYAGSGDAGSNFWVGHEMGHLTAANRNHDGTVADANARYEQMANDIPRAIAHSQGLPVFGPGEFELRDGSFYPRYSTDEPMIFVDPPVPGS